MTLLLASATYRLMSSARRWESTVCLWRGDHEAAMDRLRDAADLEEHARELDAGVERERTS